MSSLGIVLRKLPILCVAGAAGFALGRVDTRVPKANDYEVFRPMYEAPAATEYARWYPTHHRPDQDLGSLPTAGYVWPRHEVPASQAWEVIAPVSGSPRLYHSSPVLLPDARVFLPDTGAARSTDSPPPSPVSAR